MSLDLSKNILNLSYFSHDECNVCKVLKPKVKELVNNYQNCGFIYVNTVESVETAGQYSVFTVPTIIVFAEGKEVRRFSRNFGLGELKEFLDRYDKILRS